MVQIYVVTSDKHNVTNIRESPPKIIMTMMMMTTTTTMVIVCTIEIVVFWVETCCSFVDEY
jgi:hypothetical protein